MALLPRTPRAIVTVMKMELLGRVRSKKWVITLAVCVAVLAVVGILVLWGAASFHPSRDIPAEVREKLANRAFNGNLSFLLMFILSFVLVLAPALSATTINGDRETANLAILQATPITPGQLLWGKLLAAWITGAMLVLLVTLPLLAFVGKLGSDWDVLPKAVLVLLAEVFVISAVGIGFSALVTRPVISVLLSYLAVGALVVGGPMSYGFSASMMQEQREYRYQKLVYEGEGIPDEITKDYDSPYPGLNQIPGWVCQDDTAVEYAGETNRFWWLLMTSPYTIFADAAAGAQHRRFTQVSHADEGISFPYNSVLTMIADFVAQYRAKGENANQAMRTIHDVKPPRISVFDQCYVNKDGTIVGIPPEKFNKYHSDSGERITAESLGYLGNSWYWGMIFHIILAGGALATAWRRLRTPVRHLPQGVRIA